jgi:DNA-binding LytR/AlgR family response regulator
MILTLRNPLPFRNLPPEAFLQRFNSTSSQSKHSVFLPLKPFFARTVVVFVVNGSSQDGTDEGGYGKIDLDICGIMEKANMRIAACDDNLQVLDRLSKLLDAYRQKTKASFTYKVYSDGDSLLKDVHEGGFDFLLLDVMMPLVNGMQIAYEVRTFDENVKIAFLTSSPEFAVESYSVEAFAYLLKPATADNLFPILNKLFLAAQKAEEGLRIKFQNGFANLLFSRLAYVEVMNRTLCFHLTDGSVRELVAPLSDYEEALLQRPEFIRVHRSFIVSLCQIQELRTTDILTYTGSTVPISRRLYAQVRKAYVDQLFTEKGMDAWRSF